MFSRRLWERRSGEGQNLLIYYSFFLIFHKLFFTQSKDFVFLEFVTFDTV